MANVHAHGDALPKLPLHRTVPPRERAAVLLALGGTSTIAGRVLGVDPSTVRRWRQRPEFAAQVGQVRLRLLDAAAEALEGAPSPEAGR